MMAFFLSLCGCRRANKGQNPLKRTGFDFPSAPPDRTINYTPAYVNKSIQSDPPDVFRISGNPLETPEWP